MKPAVLWDRQVPASYGSGYQKSPATPVRFPAEETQSPASDPPARGRRSDREWCLTVLCLLKTLPIIPHRGEVDGRVRPSYPVIFLVFGTSLAHFFFSVLRASSWLLERCTHVPSSAIPISGGNSPVTFSHVSSTCSRQLHFEDIYDDVKSLFKVVNFLLKSVLIHICSNT